MKQKSKNLAIASVQKIFLKEPKHFLKKESRYSAGSKNIHPFFSIHHHSLNQMKIQLINRSRHAAPSYETEFSAGMDLKANLDGDVVLKSLERRLIPTGLFIALEPGTEAQIRPRSGMAYKHGLTVLNSPGTIDADYRGEVKVLLVNLSNEEVIIRDGDRIAQMVIARHEKVIFDLVDELTETTRGAGGFGSTGTR
jgi:dUTP pyrophosphatase